MQVLIGVCVSAYIGVIAREPSIEPNLDPEAAILTQFNNSIRIKHVTVFGRDASLQLTLLPMLPTKTMLKALTTNNGE